MRLINFKISEFLKSDTATKNNIDNIPDFNFLDNILDLIINCMQPIRNLFNLPVIITSGFRCQKLNKIVGGSANSQHLVGCAADFKIKSLTPDKIIQKIKNSNIEYDQLINEYDKWVHISYRKDKNRKQILKIK